MFFHSYPKPFVLFLLDIVQFDHANPGKRFAQKLSDPRHGVLLLVAKRFEPVAKLDDHPPHNRQHQQHEHGQLPIMIQKPSYQPEHNESFPHQRHHDFRHGVAKQLDFVGKFRNDPSARLAIEIAHGKTYKVAKQLATDIFDHPHSNPAHGPGAEERCEASNNGQKNQIQGDQHHLVRVFLEQGTVEKGLH